MTSRFDKLPYDPSKLNRELKPYFISADDEEIKEMLKEIGLEKLEDLLLLVRTLNIHQYNEYAGHSRHHYFKVPVSI